MVQLGDNKVTSGGLQLRNPPLTKTNEVNVTMTDNDDYLGEAVPSNAEALVIMPPSASGNGRLSSAAAKAAVMTQ